MTKTTSPIEFFSSVNATHVERTQKHSLESILFISLCAVICGAESWNEIEDYGNAKKDWLERFLYLPNGIPSNDTFNQVISSSLKTTVPTATSQSIFLGNSAGSVDTNSNKPLNMQTLFDENGGNAYSTTTNTTPPPIPGTAKFCTKCSSKLPENTRFCSNCGSPLN